MTQITKQNVISGILVTLLSSFILAAVVFYINYQVQSRMDVIKYEQLTTKIDTVIHRLANNHVLFITGIQKLDKKNAEQHGHLQKQTDSLGVCIRRLTYVIRVNNKKMSRTLENIEQLTEKIEMNQPLFSEN